MYIESDVSEQCFVDIICSECGRVSAGFGIHVHHEFNACAIAQVILCLVVVSVVVLNYVGFFECVSCISYYSF